MANCLVWKLAAMALFVAAARAAVIVDAEVEQPREGVAGMSYAETAMGFFDSKKDQFAVHQALLNQLGKKLEGSFEGVATAAEAMGNNFLVYFEKTFVQLGDDVGEYVPHVKEFYNAIPASALHKMVLDFLRTMLKQNQDHCGKIDLEYYPLHPGLTAQKDRRKRETEKMTLAKFGQAISTLFTDVDNFVVEYISKSIPVICPMIDEWLKEQIAKGEAMDPEKFKEEFKW